MADYFWELGIEWNAAIGTNGSSYLRQGFVKDGAITMPFTKEDDKIRFRIFDVTSNAQVFGPQVARIQGLDIESRAADASQSNPTGLSPSQPQIAYSGAQLSTAFGGYFPAWTSDEVFVTHDLGRYLLTFKVTVDGPADSCPRPFIHDPEMVVGSNG